MPGDLNPFKDTLANSEAVPTTQKLVEQVQIQDNYVGQANMNDESTLTQKLAPFAKKKPAEMLSQSVKLPTDNKDSGEQLSSEPVANQEESAAKKSSTTHQQNLKKRRQKKGQNLSIHQFDEATQKSIEDAVR